MGRYLYLPNKEKERKLEKERTLGQISIDLSKRDPGNHTFAEQGREQLKDYIPNLLEAVAKGKKSFPSSDFYTVVLTKNERLMPNVFRHFFFNRISCPTPNYDQALYFYNHEKDEIEFLWVIPDPRTCKFFLENILEIPHEDKCLIQYIVDFNDGTLDRLARYRNGEKELQVNPIVRIES